MAEFTGTQPAGAQLANTQPTLLINAGGESRRMGQPKALLPAPGSAVPLIRHIASRLLPLAGKLVVIANDPAIRAAVEPLGAICLADSYPDTGPLGGLATGLAVCEGWAICVACDLPFVQPGVFRFLLQQAGDDWDAVIPFVGGQLPGGPLAGEQPIGGRPQPLHALYHRRCLPAVQSALQAGKRRMDSFLADVRVRSVAEDALRPFDPSLRSFVNVNTPQEWAAASGQAIQPPLELSAPPARSTG
ncbi:MAG: molybdenum cofactor guanylyltransferase [Caldilineaceae bacterium]|nr:molybdenum cofactor guanylyltransferase [Caldilineaceae bacterium]